MFLRTKCDRELYLSMHEDSELDSHGMPVPLQARPGIGVLQTAGRDFEDERNDQLIQAGHLSAGQGRRKQTSQGTARVVAWQGNSLAVDHPAREVRAIFLPERRDGKYWSATRTDHSGPVNRRAHP